MRVGIIGLGSIARKHIAALRQICPDVALYALRHRPIEGEGEGGIKNLYSYDDLLAAEPDFIIICNPTSEHRQAIERLSEAGIALMIEKPLVDSVEESLPTVNSLSYVACNLRFLDCLEYIKEAISSDRINEVNAYCGSYLPDWRSGVDWRNCYSANKEMGGGVHIDLIHEIDYIYWLFGRPQKVDKVFRSCSSLDISAFDYANYVMQYEQFTASVVLNYYRRDYKRTLEVVTQDDTWMVDLAKNRVLKNDIEVFASDQTIGDTYLCQMRHFINSIDGGQRFNDINEAYEILKICLQ